MAKKRKIRHVVRGLLVTVGLMGLGLLGGLGWHWMATLRCERIEFSGVRHADTAALLALAQVDTGLVLFDIDPVLVEDRVQRHPWVMAVRAMRLPTGTLAIDVQERRPVALVLDRQGRPAHYLDRGGYALPLVPGAAYDVPLLRGLRTPYHPVRSLQDERIRTLLVALAAVDDETDALVSEVELRSSGEVWMRTPPVDGRGAIPVRLGRDGFTEKLARLRAFWRQAVLTQSETTYTLIDLRFDSQIITRKNVVGGP